MKNLLRGAWLVGILLSFPLVSAASLTQTLSNVWNKILYISGLSYLGVTTTSLDAFTRLLVWILIFAILFAVSALLGTGNNSFLSRNQRLIVTGIIATISVIFVPVSVLIAAGAGFGTIVGLALVGLPLIGLIFLLHALGSSCSMYALKSLIALIFLWVVTAMQYHITQLVNAGAVLIAVDQFIEWQILIATILFIYYLYRLLTCGSDSIGDNDSQSIKDLVESFREYRERYHGSSITLPPRENSGPTVSTPPLPTSATPLSGPGPTLSTPPLPTSAAPTILPGSSGQSTISSPNNPKLEELLRAIAALTLRFQHLEREFTHRIGPLAGKLREIEEKVDQNNNSIIDNGLEIKLNRDELRDVRRFFKELADETRATIRNQFDRNFQLLLERIGDVEKEFREAENRLQEYIASTAESQTSELQVQSELQSRKIQIEIEAQIRKIAELKKYTVDNFAATHKLLGDLRTSLDLLNNKSEKESTVHNLNVSLELLMQLVHDIKKEQERTIAMSPFAIHFFEVLEKITENFKIEVNPHIEVKPDIHVELNNNGNSASHISSDPNSPSPTRGPMPQRSSKPKERELDYYIRLNKYTYNTSSKVGSVDITVQFRDPSHDPKKHIYRVAVWHTKRGRRAEKLDDSFVGKPSKSGLFTSKRTNVVFRGTMGERINVNSLVRRIDKVKDKENPNGWKKRVHFIIAKKLTSFKKN